MSNDHCSSLVFFVIISGRKLKSALVSSLSEAGGRLIDVAYGKSSVHTDYLRDIFGLVPEESKAVITSILPAQKVEDVLEMLVTKFHFDKPNTGVAFSIPIDHISL